MRKNALDSAKYYIFGLSARPIPDLTNKYHSFFPAAFPQAAVTNSVSSALAYYLIFQH